jgi:hypothetical protein
LDRLAGRSFVEQLGVVDVGYDLPLGYTAFFQSLVGMPGNKVTILADGRSDQVK